MEEKFQLIQILTINQLIIKIAARIICLSIISYHVYEKWSVMLSRRRKVNIRQFIVFITYYVRMNTKLCCTCLLLLRCHVLAATEAVREFMRAISGIVAAYRSQRKR